jgi:hypothetical protein
VSRWPPNPFVYGLPVEPEELIDREHELEAMLGLADAGQPVRLSAPRRYGKTTLLRRLLLEAEKGGAACVYVDLYGAVSLEQVSDRIEGAYRRGLQGAVGRTMVNLVRTLRPRLRAMPGGVGAEVAPAAEPDARRLLEHLLDLPIALYERTGRRSLVVFDEFQEVLRAGAEVEGLIRSHIQHHVREAAYVFAGSHPALMLALFSDRERPFFGQARPIELPPLEDAPLAAYVESRFDATGRSAGDAVDVLLPTARGHPQRAMMLAHHLWEHTPPGGVADHDTWARTLAAVDAELREGFERTWERLTTNQARVLSALAAGEGTLFARRTLTAFGLTKRGAEQGRDGLVGFGDVREVAGRLQLVDPLLARWVGERRHGRR